MTSLKGAPKTGRNTIRVSIHVALSHETTYTYAEAVELTPHVVRLRPAPHCRTPILSYALTVQPEKHFINWQQDPYGNHLARFVFPEKSKKLSVRVDLVADMSVINPFDFFLEERVETFPFSYTELQKKELAPYLECQEPEPVLVDLIKELRREDVGTINYLVDLNRALQERVSYVIRMEPGVQTPAETLNSGKGSCRDSAWLAVQLLRNLGLATRFVSGYLIQLRADQESLDGPTGPTEDFTDLHAWAETYIPGAGWIGMDPTSGLLTGEGHIPLAASAEPTSAAAITGSFLWTPKEAGLTLGQEFDFQMKVERIFERPRVTLPYTEEQWVAVDQLGKDVDKVLADEDVRLTMGGEPTFVSIDDMEGAEWNTGALGEHKQKLACELLGRLQKAFAPGGLLHHGQGKHYPGESLPRWAYNCYWREDGKPIWKNLELLASPAQSSQFTEADGRRFLDRLIDELDVDSQYVREGYEDRFYYAWREGKLPKNVEMRDSKASWKEEAERLRRVFDRGLDSLVGWALPLQTDLDSTFQSGPWPVKREQLFLIPGDSPMGYRLPLESLPWAAPENQRIPDLRDPFDPAPMAFQEFASYVPPAPKEVARPEKDEPSDFVRTALCVEVREGKIFVFLPPVDRAEHFLTLMKACEKAAEVAKVQIVLEGYRPPFDARLKSFSVTPDPGVIEVNIQPCSNWGQLCEVTETLYNEARQNRLGTEKFMLDGRHSGTGGGNHLVMGGQTPADSPFLRRPDLLASMVCYWLNHPSLSYLFSGLFVGPTSQAPRIDEARQDSLYELEIALSQLPKVGAEADQLWLVDRLFRHLLTDLTGNTHRAEFCIDKLYSPDGPTGRLGLLELRAFEMPPHSQMSLLQQLLVRALVAHFWKNPYQVKPVRWGTRLHDQFLLGHYVWEDLMDVLKDLRQVGFAFEADWFRPHQEFRFPVIGSVEKGGLKLELRNAIEPWHVLGEESTGGGTARFVDSSVERIQVKTENFVEGRHHLLCNGVTVPLTPTGRQGEQVAGIRFRAWQPPSCLHPTIGVHAPLNFDIVDSWTGRSMGGCRYDVSHPGGRNYDTFPVNANEAQARRLARFSILQHSGGEIVVEPAQRSLEHPVTLDLRRFS